MNKWELLPIWFRILLGHKPFLSIKVTGEDLMLDQEYRDHDKGRVKQLKSFKQMSEPRGNRFVEGVLDLIQKNHSRHLSITGAIRGEDPLHLRQEMDVLLPRLNAMSINVQFVTNASLPIPLSWIELPNLHLVVSLNGLSPENHGSNSPDDYKKILHNIAGHKVVLHCVIDRSMLAQPDALKEFASFWSCCSEIEKICFSLYTPQQGENPEVRLTEEERLRAITAIARLNTDYAKVQAPGAILNRYRHPPSSPNACLFARTTLCIAPDLKTVRVPCRLGGQPICSECGYFESAKLAPIGRSKIGGLAKTGNILRLSHKI